MRIPTILLATAFLADPLAAQEMPPALVETAPIRELEFQQQVTLVGRTEARGESRVVAEVAGRVRSVDAAEGRAVKRGQTLVTIDCRRTALALEAKRAEAAQAKADADLADKELARAKDLVETEVFPERNLDRAAADAARTAARFRQLDAESRQLDLDLANCAIRAPFSGHTVRKLVDVGEWVDPGTPVYELVDLAVVKVTVDLPERYFGQLDADAPVTIVLDRDGDTELAGEITGLAPRASEATHTFPVILAVENRDRRLGSGMLVRAVLTLEGTFTGLAVSKDAIVREGERTFLYTVTDGRAVAVPVRIRSRSGTLVAIDGDGLAAGQPVVVRGNERLYDGGAVREGGS